MGSLGCWANTSALHTRPAAKTLLCIRQVHSVFIGAFPPIFAVYEHCLVARVFDVSLRRLTIERRCRAWLGRGVRRRSLVMGCAKVGAVGMLAPRPLVYEPKGHMIVKLPLTTFQVTSSRALNGLCGAKLQDSFVIVFAKRAARSCVSKVFRHLVRLPKCRPYTLHSLP